MVVGVDHVEEALEEPDLSSFLTEELENRFSLLLDHWAVWMWWQQSGYAIGSGGSP
jgi:hypothetical protein